MKFEIPLLLGRNFILYSIKKKKKYEKIKEMRNDYLNI